MEVKFNFNIEICHFQDELQALGCLNTFLEDYSEWNSLGHYSPSLTKFALASAPPIAAKHGWNSSSVILPLPLRAEKRHINCQMAATDLKTRPLRSSSLWNLGLVGNTSGGWGAGSPETPFPAPSPAPVPYDRVVFPDTLAPLRPTRAGQPRDFGNCGYRTGLTLCFRFTNDWNKIWWNLRR